MALEHWQYAAISRWTLGAVWGERADMGNNSIYAVYAVFSFHFDMRHRCLVYNFKRERKQI